VAAADDAFGRWNESRDSILRQTIAERRLPGELRDFESELDQYGAWSYLPPYGSVWMPRGLGLGWHPYLYGRWVWLPLCGWTWMSYDPWGWAPYHYGRWGWDIRLGWYWIPTTIWGPAWVDWWWADDYFGWAPLGWYGYPLAFINDRCYDRWDQEYPYNSKVLTVIHKNQLTAPDVSKIAVGLDELKHVGVIRLTGNTMLAPRPINAARLTQERLGDNRVLLKSPGREAGTREIRRPTMGAAGSTSSTTARKIVEHPARGTTTQSTSSGSSTPRKIRKDDSTYSPSTKTQSTDGKIKRENENIVGYPSRTENSQGMYGIRSLRYSSPLERFYGGTSQGSISQYSTRSGSGSYGFYGSSGSGSSRSSSSSRGSSSSSSSHGSSSSHSTSSSSSHSSGSSGGSHGHH
jgi:hypothetical protein